MGSMSYDDLERIFASMRAPEPAHISAALILGSKGEQMDFKGARKLQKRDVVITSFEVSGDGENWETSSQMDNFGNGGFAHLLDLIANGERVFIRTKYADIYDNGKRGLPKTGAIYEMKLDEIQPIRQVVELPAADVKHLGPGQTVMPEVVQAAQSEAAVKEFIHGEDKKK